ncbi:MAG: tetratricopeptide repeat protein [Myxococcales bacterium]|nr:tetratricopeptide repeat protein [Myxococcales bacterium]
MRGALVELLDGTPHRRELAYALFAPRRRAHARRRWADQRCWHERTLALALELGDLSAQANAHVNLGVVLANLGELTAAVAHTERAVALCQRTGARPTIGLALSNLGGYLLELGDLDRASARLAEGIRLLDSVGQRRVLPESSSTRPGSPPAAATADLARAAIARSRSRWPGPATRPTSRSACGSPRSSRPAPAPPTRPRRSWPRRPASPPPPTRSSTRASPPRPRACTIGPGGSRPRQRPGRGPRGVHAARRRRRSGRARRSTNPLTASSARGGRGRGWPSCGDRVGVGSCGDRSLRPMARALDPVSRARRATVAAHHRRSSADGSDRDLDERGTGRSSACSTRSTPGPRGSSTTAPTTARRSRATPGSCASSPTRHHGKEEDLLFEAMVEHGFSREQGPLAVMLHEHGSAGR